MASKNKGKPKPTGSHKPIGGGGRGLKAIPFKGIAISAAVPAITENVESLKKLKNGDPAKPNSKPLGSYLDAIILFLAAYLLKDAACWGGGGYALGLEISKSIKKSKAVGALSGPVAGMNQPVISGDYEDLAAELLGDEDDALDAELLGAYCRLSDEDYEIMGAELLGDDPDLEGIGAELLGSELLGSDDVMTISNPAVDENIKAAVDALQGNRGAMLAKFRNAFDKARKARAFVKNNPQARRVIEHAQAVVKQRFAQYKSGTKSKLFNRMIPNKLRFEKDWRV